MRLSETDSVTDNRNWILAVAAGGLVAGCGGVASPAKATTTTIQAATPTTTAAGASTPASNVPTTATASPPPILGLTGAWFEGRGFGEVEPSEVFLGGDPTGLVTAIAWKSWGGSTATGTGTSTYVGPNQNTAEGSEQPATIVAFDLGTCAGHVVYQQVEWYFAGEGGRFDPSQAEYTCTMGYVSANR